MAGKSTYLRQVALIVLLAQIGSFVPAERARIGVVDRIFTRIGAQDHLQRGHSTFMVEMHETANILHNATSHSLLILDEIGRGTSTYDGLSIAWAVIEHIACAVRARTLCATHYHELAELEVLHTGVKNYHVAVRETLTASRFCGCFCQEREPQLWHSGGASGGAAHCRRRACDAGARPVNEAGHDPHTWEASPQHTYFAGA